MGNFKPTHRHYKGGLYRLLHAECRHSETEERLVIYQGADCRVWARPWEMFYGNIEDGRRRFEPLKRVAFRDAQP